MRISKTLKMRTLQTALQFSARCRKASRRSPGLLFLKAPHGEGRSVGGDRKPDQAGIPCEWGVDQTDDFDIAVPADSESLEGKRLGLNQQVDGSRCSKHGINGKQEEQQHQAQPGQLRTYKLNLQIILFRGTKVRFSTLSMSSNIYCLFDSGCCYVVLCFHTGFKVEIARQFSSRSK